MVPHFDLTALGMNSTTSTGSMSSASGSRTPTLGTLGALGGAGAPPSNAGAPGSGIQNTGMKTPTAGVNCFKAISWFSAH